MYRIGFPEMPDLSLKVTPLLGESSYSYNLIHDFLEARIRDELKVNFVQYFPCNLPRFDSSSSEWLFFHRWTINYYHSSTIGSSMSCQ